MVFTGLTKTALENSLIRNKIMSLLQLDIEDVVCKASGA